MKKMRKIFVTVLGVPVGHNVLCRVFYAPRQFGYGGKG